MPEGYIKESDLHHPQNDFPGPESFTASRSELEATERIKEIQRRIDAAKEMELAIAPNVVTSESGEIIGIEENDERFLVTIGEHGSDYAIGFVIFKDRWSNLPILFFGEPDRSTFQVGDKVEVVGFGSDYGIQSLTVNGEKWFCYTDKQAQAIDQIRRANKEVDVLVDFLEESFKKNG